MTVPAHVMRGDWIPKLPSVHYEGVTENEYSVMALTATAGIETSETALVPMDRIVGLPAGALKRGMPAEPALAMRRFDRTPRERVHGGFRAGLRTAPAGQ